MFQKIDPKSPVVSTVLVLLVHLVFLFLLIVWMWEIPWHPGLKVLVGGSLLGLLVWASGGTIRSSRSMRQIAKQKDLLLRSFEAFENIYLYILDPDYTYLALNTPDVHFMEEYFQIHPEIGKKATEFLQDDALDKFLENMALVRQKDYHQSMDHFVIRGKDIYLYNSYYVLRDKQGNIEAISCVTMNMTDRVEERKKAEALIYQDDLTHVYNRRKLEEEFNNWKGDNRDFHFVLMDIDDFKGLNDTLGHLAGDKFLVDFAKVLKKTLSPYSMIYRIGGDEFALMIDQVDWLKSYRLKESLIAELRGLTTYPISVSMGYIHVEAGDKLSLDQAYQEADRKMYQEKYKGKGK